MDVSATMDRDQRTVRVRDRHRVDGPHEYCACALGARAHPRQHTHNSLSRRLGEVLTLSACLLSLAQWPTAMSAPSRRRSIPPDHPRLWVNPCGFDNEAQQPAMHDVLLSDSGILDTIIVTAGIALDSVQGFKNDYVKETFDVDFKTHHNTWKDKSYDWLFLRDKVPKSLGHPTKSDHLESIELNKFLPDAYRLLQTMAVALEQVAWDQGHHDSDFAKHFKDIEFKLRAVLCEIQMAMAERNVEPHPDVTRDVMADEFRNLTDTFRHLRDWFIFRDYMIVLEYIKEVFQYFVKHPSRITPSC